MTRETKSYELKIYDQSLMRFEAAYDAFGSLKLEITDIDSANAHLLPLNLIVDQDEKSLASWMEGRTIPKNRAFVEQILSTAGLTRNDILGILDVSKGLSINDSYWLDDGKSDVTFDEINLFDNRFDEVLGLVAYTGYTPSQKHKAGVSSEWTLGGQFPKAVRRINDRLLLFKTGTSGARNLGKEPYSEYFAAQVAKRMGIDHVSYDLEMWKGKLASVCGLMNDKEISFVPFFVAAGDASFPAALSILNELDPKMASKYRTMVVFDALICNRDRHGGNFGILRENRTGRLLGLAPVFDHNLSLFAQDDETDYAPYVTSKDEPVNTWASFPVVRYGPEGEPGMNYTPSELTMDEYFNTCELFFEDAKEEKPNLDGKKLPPTYTHMQKVGQTKPKEWYSEYKNVYSKVEFLDDYKIKLRKLGYGASPSFDLKNYVFSDSAWYALLRDPKYFEQGRLTYIGEATPYNQSIVWPDNQYVRLVELFIDRKRTRGKKYWFSAIEAGFVANGRYDQWVKYVWDGKPENMLSV